MRPRISVRGCARPLVRRSVNSCLSSVNFTRNQEIPIPMPGGSPRHHTTLQPPHPPPLPPPLHLLNNLEASLFPLELVLLSWSSLGRGSVYLFSNFEKLPRNSKRGSIRPLIRNASSFQWAPNGRKRSDITGKTVNKANSHKSRALGTISYKIYKNLQNIHKSQKCMEVSEMIRSVRC